MKKQCSFFMLLVRTGFWKVLTILASMTLSQVVLFFAMGVWESTYLLDALNILEFPSALVVIIGLICMFYALIIPLSDRGGRMNNLILRLGISEKQIFWIHVVFCFLAYSMFIMTQSLTMILLCVLHDWMTPGTMDPMAIFVTSYQFPLFHRFFPMHNMIGWINHLLIMTGLSICTAAAPIRQRHRFGSHSAIIMFVIAYRFYTVSGNVDYLHYSEMFLPFFATLILVSISLFGVLSMEVDEYGKP